MTATATIASPRNAQEAFILQVAEREIRDLDESCHIYPTVKINARFTYLLGRATYELNLIEITRHLTSADRGQIIDTARHEYAHLLAYKRYDSRIAPHGPEWRQAALDCGAMPQRCAPTHSLSRAYRAATRRPSDTTILQCPGCQRRQSLRVREIASLACPMCDIPLAAWSIVE